MSFKDKLAFTLSMLAIITGIELQKFLNTWCCDWETCGSTGSIGGMLTLFGVAGYFTLVVTNEN